jgi:hypothetical protein
MLVVDSTKDHPDLHIDNDGSGMATYKGIPMEGSLARYLADQDAALRETRDLLRNLHSEREEEKAAAEPTQGGRVARAAVDVADSPLRPPVSQT